jgi:hypothetical protein
VYGGGSGFVLRVKREELEPAKDEGKEDEDDDDPPWNVVGMKGKAEVVVGEGLT